MYDKNIYKLRATDFSRSRRKRLAEDVNVYPEFGGVRKTGQLEILVGC
jgi:hypothetical protein